MDARLDIPRFLNRKEIARVMAERGVSFSKASLLLLDEDAGTPMPRIRTRTRSEK